MHFYLSEEANTMSEAKLGGHPLFYKLRRENEALYSAKHYQYATDADPMSNFRRCGTLIDKLLKPGVNRTLAAALTLMSKQVVGVYEIVGEQKANTVESLEDKLRDIEIYATICQVLLKEDWPPGELTPTSVTPTSVKDGPYCDSCDKLAELRSPHGVYFCRGCIPQTWLLKDFTVLDGGKL